MILSSIVRFPKNVDFDGKDSDERVMFVFRKSFLANIPWIFITLVAAAAPTILGPFLLGIKSEGARLVSAEFALILSLFFYLFAFGFALQNFLNWFFNVLIVTDKKIMDVDFIGLIYKNISEASLTSIEDVTSNVHGTLGIIFNIGDVYIQTAAEVREFEFSLADDPAKIRDLISDLVADIKSKGRAHDRLHG